MAIALGSFPTLIGVSARLLTRSTGVTVPDGGYDLEAVGDSQTKVTIYNTFEGHGFGKLIVGFALKAAIKDAPALADRIKTAAEAS